MRHNLRKPFLRLLVVGSCLLLLFLFIETPVCVAVEVLDSMSEYFQTIGARCQQVPTNISPDCTYVVPIRYNFGDPNPGQRVRLRLLGPNQEIYHEEDFTVPYYHGYEEILVQVPSYAAIGESASWEIGMYDYQHPTIPILELVTSDITAIEPVFDVGSHFSGMDGHPGWDGMHSSIGCTNNDVDDCLDEITSSIVGRFFDWIADAFDVVSDEATVLNPFSIGTDNEKRLAGRLRAYKVYKGFEYGHNRQGSYTKHGVGAKQKMIITSGDGLARWDIMNGYTIEGKQKVSNHPPGYGGDGKGIALGNHPFDPVMVGLGYQELTVGGSRYAAVLPEMGFGHDYGSMSSADTGYADDDPGGADERIDIDYDITYDDLTNTITISYGVQGTASWPMWGACAVEVRGGSDGEVTFSASGDEIEMEFALVKAGVSFECGVPPNPPSYGHPCWHGEVECNVGIIMKITYPDSCSVRFEFELQVAAGAHAEIWAAAASQSYEICTSYSEDLGQWDYDICDDAEIQDWIDDEFSTLLDSLNNNYYATIGYILRNY